MISQWIQFQRILRNLCSVGQSPDKALVTFVNVDEISKSVKEGVPELELKAIVHLLESLV